MSSLSHFISTRTPKFKYMLRAVGDQPFTLLDIGAGNGSPSKTTKLFPACTYHGIDLSYEYGYGKEDIAAISRFFEMDLTKLEFDRIPDDHYDYVNMAHIIEHLHNGDEVVRRLAPKIKKHGHIYIEYPGKKSTKLPSMYGTLNFYDDKTHVRVYSVAELSGVLRDAGFEVISGGTRRSWFYILFMPFLILGFLLKGKKVPAPVFWDLLGFAEYVYARKK